MHKMNKYNIKETSKVINVMSLLNTNRVLWLFKNKFSKYWK